MSAEIIPQVRKWGYEIAVITDFQNDPGLEFANTVAIAKTKDPTAALEAAHKIWNAGYHFGGVISLCWDCAISVSTIAEKYGLRGLPISVAKNSTLKHLRSRILMEQDIPSPKFGTCGGYSELEMEANRIGYPIIIKPIDQSSSKGVILVKDESELKKSYQYALSFSTTGQLIVNQYIVGSEHSVEGLLTEGRFYPTGITDRVFEYQRYAPYFVEIGDIMPSVLSPIVVQNCYDVTAAAAGALGINNGPVKSDLIVNERGQVFVLELAARLGGPRLGTEMIPLSNGTCVLRAAIQQAMGEAVDISLLSARYARGMVNRSIFPTPGQVIAIEGLSELIKIPGYYDFKWWKEGRLEVGDVISEPRYGCGDVGYIIATGATREQALVAADLIENTIGIATTQNEEHLE